MNSLLLSALAVFMPVGEQRAQPVYIIEKRKTKRIRAVLSMKAKHPKLKAAEWFLFGPQAPELANQTDVRTTSTPKGTLVTEKSHLARGVVLARVPVTTTKYQKEVEWKITYEATLFDRKLRPLKQGEKAPAVANLSKTDKRNYLKAHGTIDFTNVKFKQWLNDNQLTRGAGETMVGFAKRAFLTIRKNFQYEFALEQNRHASNVCFAKKTDCTGFSILMVSIMRANGVPARVLYGRWARSAKKGEKIKGVLYYQMHVIAEFHAEGIGWAPIDVSSAIEYDTSKDGLTYFGQNLGGFFALHVDPDFELDTIRFGIQKLRALQIPAYWLTGSGSIQPNELTQDWQVTKIPEK